MPLPEPQIHSASSVSPASSGSPASPDPCGTLLGEYLTILGMGHAVICGAMCLTIALQQSASIVPFLASLWIVAMGLEIGTNRVVNTVITLLLTISCVAVQTSTSLQLPLLFSPVAVILLLLVVLQRESWRWWQTYDVPALQQRLKTLSLKHGQRVLFLGFVLLIVLLPIVRAIIDEFTQSAAARASFARMTFIQNLMFRLFESLTAFFFFVIGTCVGSFLNVVIYRVPRGISTLVTPSHCPDCSEKIHGRDNSPLLGWLKLEGKCRNCGVTISARYPTIELTVGLVFLLLYFVQLISGGMNLAGRMTPTYAGVLWILFYTKWPLVWLYIYHTVLFCTLLSWAMIRYDGQKVPRLSIGVMMLMLAVVPLFEPVVQPYPAGIDGSKVAALEAPGMISLLGVLAAVPVWGLFRLLRKSTPPGDFASWLLLGIALGWQAVLGIGGLLLSLTLLYDSLCRRGERPLAVPHQAWLALPAVALLHHCLWKIIAGLPVL